MTEPMTESVDAKEAPDKLVNRCAGEVDSAKWLIRHLPSGPVYRCPDCGREGQNCFDVQFYHIEDERQSARFCLDCVWALAEKHLTPLEDVTNG